MDEELLHCATNKVHAQMGSEYGQSGLRMKRDGEENIYKTIVDITQRDRRDNLERASRLAIVSIGENSRKIYFSEGYIPAESED